MTIVQVYVPGWSPVSDALADAPEPLPLAVVLPSVEVPVHVMVLLVPPGA